MKFHVTTITLVRMYIYTVNVTIKPDIIVFHFKACVIATYEGIHLSYPNRTHSYIKYSNKTIDSKQEGKKGFVRLVKWCCSGRGKKLTQQIMIYLNPLLTNFRGN